MDNVTLGRNCAGVKSVDNDLRCHVCGKALFHVFCLGSMSRGDVDRPFLLHPECAKRVDALALIVSVQRVR